MKVANYIAGAGLGLLLLNIVSGLSMIAAGVPNPPWWLMAWLYLAGVMSVGGLIASLVAAIARRNVST